MTRQLSRSCPLTTWLVAVLLAGPLLADAAAQVSVPGTYPTIQAAIDAVPSGTTINVQPGTYAEALLIANTNRSITIRGLGGAAATIVDAAGRGAAAINVWRSTGVITIDGLRVEYPDGFGLARASNTTPVIVLRFEADNEPALRRIQEDFRRELRAAAPKATLPF